MAEKFRATYDLDTLKVSFSSVSKLNLTGTALKSATSFGFGRIEVLETVQSMQREHFYKSMTSHADHRVWQDVYHVPSVVGLLYVKFTADLVTEFLILSFKEKNRA